MLALFDKGLLALHHLNDFLFGAVVLGYGFALAKNFLKSFARN